MPKKLSVIMPVYNSEKWLKEALDSVLSQTFIDFELLIYDDGSSDSSPKILESYGDTRIKVKTFKNNNGLIHCLNCGLKDAKGEYIARMDADDICKPERFAKQVEFLDLHKEIGICGTQISIINSQYNHTRPCTDDELRWWIFKGSPFAHPSVMLRSRLIHDYSLSYNNQAYVAEDFDLWWKLAFHCKLANLNEKLLEYRIHDAQESTTKSNSQLKNHQISLIEFLNAIGINSNRFDIKWINDMLVGDINSTPSHLIKTHNFFDALKKSENANRFFGSTSIEEHKIDREKFYLKNLTSYSLVLISWAYKKESWNLIKKSGINPFVFIIKSLLMWKTRS